LLPIRRPADPPASWSKAQRVIHWTIAALVGLGFAIGLYMVGLPFRELLQKFLLYQLHKTIGITVLALAVTQIVLHARRGRPAGDRDLPRWQSQAAAVAHGLLFALLIVTPLFGYLTAATAPAKVPTLFLGVIPIPHIVGTSKFWFAILRRVHLTLAVILVLLACGHALAALDHHRKGRRTLIAMWRG
jgi:cytochrome b561